MSLCRFQYVFCLKHIYSFKSNLIKRFKNDVLQESLIFIQEHFTNNLRSPNMEARNQEQSNERNRNNQAHERGTRQQPNKNNQANERIVIQLTIPPNRDELQCRPESGSSIVLRPVGRHSIPCKGKGKGKSKSGGGWMNKAVQLMAAVFDGRWDDCTELSAEFLVQNETAKELVSRTNCVCVAKHMCSKRLYADRCCRSISFELASRCPSRVVRP